MNHTILIRRSTDFGATWLPTPTAGAPFAPGLVPNVIYDRKADRLVSMGLCYPLNHPSTAAHTAASGNNNSKNVGGAFIAEHQRERSSSGGNCSAHPKPRAATCSWTSKDEGATWKGPLHVGNYSYGEGGGQCTCIAILFLIK